MAKKKPTKKSSCDCLDKIKDKLAEQGVAIKRHLQLNFATREGSLSPPSLVVEKIDKKRGKLPLILCSYCPFCGTKY